MSEPTEESAGFVFNDKRRIDPQTGQVRESSGAPSPEAEAPEASSGGEDTRVAELTADLQRLQAEYQNYRKRVERDRQLVREQAIANALAELMPILDDVERARAHGDLEGAFKSVGESLESAVARLGLERFGEAGEEFDPTHHEAIALVPSPDVTTHTTTAVHQVGYRYAGRVVRPAVVSVAEPAGPGADETP